MESEDASFLESVVVSGEEWGVAWMSRNCSFSEFLPSGDRLTLSSYNSFPHLDDDALLTYR